MERESYNIDDILSEVKKRREEQENELKAQKPAEDNKKVQEKKKPAPENKKTDADKKAPVKNETAQKKPAQKQSAKKAEQPKAKTQPQEKKPVKNQENVKADEKKQTSSEQKQKAKAKPEQKTQKAEDKEDFKIEPKQNEKPEPKEEKADNSEMVDILKIADTPLEELLPDEPEKEKFFKTKKGKIVKAVIIILVLLIVAAGAFAFYFVNNMLNNMTDTDDDDYDPYQAIEYYNGMDFLQEDFPMIEEQSAYDVYSYKEYLKYWYQNGDPVRSSHVLNVLLIGEDTIEEEILDTSRADSAIIASVNVDTGTIHLTSVLRDLFVYYEINGEGHYGKINESALDGMSNYIYTLERYYKISIDNYAVVNFASFPKIIDALGGVDINITTREINEINNNPYVYGDAGLVTIEKTFEGSEGVMRLDGLQALAYCRIRHIDSDNVRADRQKAVLNELFNKAKAAGTLDTVKLVNQLSQYTKTGYTKKELVSIGNTALRDGWLNFDIQSTNVPALENSKGGETFPVFRAWIWLADIPKDAYELQQQIYGKSNIQLNENRPDYISMGSRY